MPTSSWYRALSCCGSGFVGMLACCYLVEERATDSLRPDARPAASEAPRGRADADAAADPPRARADAAADAPRAGGRRRACPAEPRACGSVADRPLLAYGLDGDLLNRGTAPGYDGVASGDIRYVEGATGRALLLEDDSHVTFPGTASLLASATGLTFSVRVRSTAHDRTFLDCRSFDRGFESYGTTAVRLTTCAGHGYGPPLGWGACASVEPCEREWAHFLFRWRGVGTEPEVAVDGSGWQVLQASDVDHMHAPVAVPASLDLFDRATDLVTGGPAGSDGPGPGSTWVDDIRVYGSALPDDQVWTIASCPVP